MPDEAIPPEPVSPDRVVAGLQARREQLQKWAIKFRFKWLFLFAACLIGTGVNAAIDLISGSPSLADWYQGGLVGVGFYLLALGLFHAGIRANLTEINRTLAGSDTNLQTSAIPPPPHPQGVGPPPERNWRDHPLAVAAIVVAGTIILMVTAIFPIWDKEKDNQIAELKVEPTKLKNELDGLRSERNRLESENLKLRRDLDRLSPDKLFSLDDVYPKGFRAVRIGDRIDLLAKVYGAEADIIEDESPGWISVKFKNPHVFSQITYYYYAQATSKKITMILFHFDNKDGRTFDMLKQQLIDTYSQSKMKEVENWRHKTELQWSGINKHVITLGDGTLHIERSDTFP